MICPRCKSSMLIFRRSHHKQRKWKCPKCGRVRMQQQKSERKKKPDRRH